MKTATPIPLKAAAVEVKGLCKRFGKQEVLREISFSVEPGEIFVIMGPSGSGKSVLLKHIVGLDFPTAGETLIDGRDIARSRTRRETRIALVFQEGALFNSMSVYENLALYPHEHRLYDKSVLKEKVTQALKMLSLEDAAEKLPSELSGGMRKRVAIARALVMEPQLLLYDEPTSELDPVMAANISEIIATLREKLEVTSIVVSHDPKLAFTIADRVALIMKGEIVTIEIPDRLRESADPRVEEFFNPQIDLLHPRFRKQETEP